MHCLRTMPSLSGGTPLLGLQRTLRLSFLQAWNKGASLSPICSPLVSFTWHFWIVRDAALQIIPALPYMISHLSCASMLCRYGLSADIYSFGITIIEVALGHTPYMDMSFRQIVTKKAANAGQPMLAVNTHGKQFSQVGMTITRSCRVSTTVKQSSAILNAHGTFRGASQSLLAVTACVGP